MNCPTCKMVDMRVEKVEDEIIYYICPKCKAEIEQNVNELEDK